MPEGVTNTGAPPQGGATPPMPGAPPPEQPAGGAGGATMPTPNRGLEAQVLSVIAGLTQLLQQAASKLPAGTDAARDIFGGIDKIRKHLRPADMSEGVISSGAKQMMMQQRQQGPQIAAMRAAQPAGAPPPATPPQPQQAG